MGKKSCGGGSINPKSVDHLIIPAFRKEARSVSPFLWECGGKPFLETLLGQVDPVTRELGMEVIGFGDDSRVSDVFRRHGLRFVAMAASEAAGTQRLLPPGTQAAVEKLASDITDCRNIMVISPNVFFHDPGIIRTAFHDFVANQMQPTFSMTLETEPIYNLNDQEGPFSIEALWHYDAEEGRMFNHLSGKHFYRRQDAPPVYRADRVISVLSPSDVNRFDLLVDRSGARPFMVDGSSYVVLMQITDIVRCEIMPERRTSNGNIDASSNPSA